MSVILWEEFDGERDVGVTEATFRLQWWRIWQESLAMMKKDLISGLEACDFRGEVRKVERERQELQIRDER